MENNLRLILFIIGICLVVGIYLWEVLRKKKNVHKTDILNAVDEVPDSSFQINQNFSKEDYSKAITDLNELSDNLRESTASLSLNSLKPEIDSSNIDNESTNNKKDEYTEPADNLLILYITSSQDKNINGLSIYKVLKNIGMEFGQMNIFHYFEDKNNEAEQIMNFIESSEQQTNQQPIFSIANMHEPGAFDIENIDELKTKGLVAFMYKNEYIDNYEIFDNVFLPKIKIISNQLGADIRMQDQKLCDDLRISGIKEQLRLDAMKNFLKE